MKFAIPHLAALGAILLACAGHVNAQNSAESSSGWSTFVTPYIWAASAKGHVVSQGQRSEVDTPFSKTLKNVDLTGMAQIEFARGKAGFWLDGLYSKVSEDQTLMTMPVVMHTTTRTLSGAAYYRVYESGSAAAGGGSSMPFAVEPYLGIRNSLVKADIEGPGFNVANRIDWSDALIGARLKLDLDASWKLMAMVDASGLGSNSHRSEFGQLLVGYKTTLFGKPSMWMLGYRALHQRYTSGLFEWNVTQSGLGAGLSMQF